jgi:hypothetical protein
MAEKDEVQFERRERRERKPRKPVGGVQQRLQAPERKGYYRRWVNEDPGRLQRFEEAGYQFVQDKEAIEKSSGVKLDTRIRQIVGVHENGSPKYGFLMELPMKFYTQDQAAKQAELDEVDEQLRGGLVKGADGSDRSKFYPSSQGRGITVETR